MLVVDDTPDNVFLASILLQRNGAQVFSAGSGYEALEQITQRDFDLILMDIQMPDMDGFETLQRIRRAGYQKPVIALTAHAMTDERKHCLESGFNFHLSKPYEFDEFIATILKCLQKESGKVSQPGPTMSKPASSEAADHLVH
jgi:CheY-like chemotaxis protein